MIDNVLLVFFAYLKIGFEMAVSAGVLWIIGIAWIAATDKPKNRRFRSSFGWL